MSKPFPYWIRLFVVSSLSVLLTFNPVFAGRLLQRMKGGSQAPSSCCEPVVTCEVVPSCVPVAPCESVATPSCGCDAVPAVMEVPDCGCGVPAAPSHSMPHESTQSPPAPLEPAPVEPAPTVPQVSPIAPEPAAVTPAPVEPTVAEPAPVEPAPVEPAPVEPAPVEPAPVEPAPGTSPFAEPAMPAVPAVEAPAPTTPAPADDIFGAAPPAEAPVVQPDVPMEKPVTPPAVTDDLFGAPVDPAPAPAAPADLFDAAPAPATTAPADDLFGDAPKMTPPATEPATPAPASGLEDLFGTEPAPAAPKVEPPATKNDLNDLFNSTEPSTRTLDSGDAVQEPAVGRVVSTDMPSASSLNSSENADADIDALFGTLDASNATEKKSSSDIDSIFGPQASPNQAVEAPSEKSSESTLDSDLDDLFKTTSSESADHESFRGAEFRTWNDNTGGFSVSARLSVIFPDRVRLLKDNGKFTTVPLSRLSPSDQQYVGWVAISLQKTNATKLVNTQTNPGAQSSDVTR